MINTNNELYLYINDLIEIERLIQSFINKFTIIIVNYIIDILTFFTKLP